MKESTSKTFVQEIMEKAELCDTRQRDFMLWLLVCCDKQCEFEQIQGIDKEFFMKGAFFGSAMLVKYEAIKK